MASEGSEILQYPRLFMTDGFMSFPIWCMDAVGSMAFIQAAVWQTAGVKKPSETQREGSSFVVDMEKA
ncbi:hypothetical protein ASPVEDRAFT_37815 [Aspergillus versicolor CBS 583.65]|uniref:Uncharacterized protein n=1 Tax=Aspergillus versicolor CBS 583.65 TaxID=1036611 RepID=A0A1L9PA22_ASPVE|nr:uncharacterized protein ASPVEDRAFT_37815 [Aspergillus versicolor CBS 583.65]OJI98380.1 hypothetical protein ASPVEDRAFT_37815 [Aspergillus versicolor CBS 583.65]